MTTRKVVGFVVVFLVIGWLAYKPLLRAWHRAPVEVYREGWQIKEGEVVAHIRLENNALRTFQYELLLEPPYLVEYVKGILAQSDEPITCMTGMIPRMSYGTLTPGQAISVSVPVGWLDASTTNRPGLLIKDLAGERTVWGQGFRVPWWIQLWE